MVLKAKPRKTKPRASSKATKVAPERQDEASRAENQHIDQTASSDAKCKAQNAAEMPGEQNKEESDPMVPPVKPGKQKRVPKSKSPIPTESDSSSQQVANSSKSICKISVKTMKSRIKPAGCLFTLLAVALVVVGIVATAAAVLASS